MHKHNCNYISWILFWEKSRLNKLQNMPQVTGWLPWHRTLHLLALDKKVMMWSSSYLPKTRILGKPYQIYYISYHILSYLPYPRLIIFSSCLILSWFSLLSFVHHIQMFTEKSRFPIINLKNHTTIRCLIHAHLGSDQFKGAMLSWRETNQRPTHPPFVPLAVSTNGRCPAIFFRVFPSFHGPICSAFFFVVDSWKNIFQLSWIKAFPYPNNPCNLPGIFTHPWIMNASFLLGKCRNIYLSHFINLMGSIFQVRPAWWITDLSQLYMRLVGLDFHQKSLGISSWSIIYWPANIWSNFKTKKKIRTSSVKLQMLVGHESYVLEVSLVTKLALCKTLTMNSYVDSMMVDV